MKRSLLLWAACGWLMVACVPSKKYKELEGRYNSLEELQKTTNSSLVKTTADLGFCNEERARLVQEVLELKKTNKSLTESMAEMIMLSRKEAENMQTSLQKIKEKDVQIKSLNEAINKRDSMTIALVTSIKKAVGVDDKDIEVNVEKGVVMVSISDKFLFKAGSYEINTRANEVLGKVALILQDKPTFEVMIEGHTDNVPFRRGDLIDNWDLSVKRATALARTLQNQFKIDPKRLIPAGRAEFIPIAPNNTVEGRAANRRTRIIIMPSIEEFYGMIEEELDKAGKK